MSLSFVYAGVDVSKYSLEVCFPDRPNFQVANTPAGLRKLMHKAANTPGLAFCCEASGGYEQSLLQACFQAAVPVALVPANRVRHWAHSQGILAKTDALDAQVIASFATSSQLRLLSAPHPASKRLQALLRRRDFEKQQLVALRNHLRLEQIPQLKRMGRRQIRAAEKRIQKLEKWIDHHIESVDCFRKLATRMEQTQGIGRLTSACAIAEIPQLGNLGGQAASAFAGVAPFNQDTGTFRGPRHIRGGRARLRQALYMASLSASHHNPILKDFYQRLLLKGKPKKVALIAVARKLIRLMERIAADPSFSPS